MLYDTIIIGAGIAGCLAAYTLQQKGQRVLLVDRSAVAASGGSGAAGAFVSPKIGKGSSLQTLTNEAYEYAKNFYLKDFPEYFHQTGVIRIPKDTGDAEKFKYYEMFNDAKYSWMSKEKLKNIGIKNSEDSFLFEEAGVCDAPQMCRAIWNKILVKQMNVKKLVSRKNQTSSIKKTKDIIWCVISDVETEIIEARNIIIATGYQNNFFDMRYMGVKGTWGSRGDYYSKLRLDVSMHKSISVSANINGIIKLGATHVKSLESCIVCDGKPLKSLEEKAEKLIDSSDFIHKETFCGMRAGSKDYFPLVGKVIDVHYMLKTYPGIVRGSKPELKYLDNIYVLNGLGGRGFVFAPLMAKILAEFMIKNKPIDSRINPDRLFLKWCRKLNI